MWLLCTYVSGSTAMSAGDCYELGKALYNEKDFANALAWMMEALRKYTEDDEARNFSEVDILEYISFSHYLLGKMLACFSNSFYCLTM